MSQDFTDDCFGGGHVAQTDLQNIENNFAALKSTFSGASAPPNAVAGMFWYDTNNNILKLRNEANNAWISVFDFANSVCSDDTVDTTAIVDDAVTNAKLADNAVNTAQLIDGAVTAAKLASDATPWSLFDEDDPSGASYTEFTNLTASKKYRLSFNIHS